MANKFLITNFKRIIRNKLALEIMMILLVIYINVFIHSINLGQTVPVFTDAGVYLYSAKLLSEGFIPYRDFFLAHPFYLIYLGSFVLKILDFNMISFNIFYILWFFSSLFAIYFIVKKITNSKISSFLSLVVFSTFAEMVQWDAHSFALRQGSLPFLAFGMYFLVVKYKPILAALLLSLFSLSLVTNAVIGTIFVSMFILVETIQYKSFKKALRTHIKLIFIFFLTTLLGYILIFILPNSIINMIDYQIQRPEYPFSSRVQFLKDFLVVNWPIFLLGGLGSLVVTKHYAFFGLFNILTFVFIFLGGKTFAPHYLTIMGAGLAISSGILVGKLLTKNITKIVTSFVIIFVIFHVTSKHFQFYLFEYQTPGFLKQVEVLKQVPEPLFTFEPIYALYANKELTLHYHTADMRYFRVMGTNLTTESYFDIIKRSNSILIESFAQSFLPPEIRYYIDENFYSIYQNNESQIYVRKAIE